MHGTYVILLTKINTSYRMTVSKQDVCISCIAICVEWIRKDFLVAQV